MSSLPNVASSIPGSGDQPPENTGVGDQQNVGQTYDEEKYVLVEREKLSNVGDINNAIHDAQAYQESQRNGMVELGEYLKEQNYSPWEIQRILQNQGTEVPGDGQPPPVPPVEQSPDQPPVPSVPSVPPAQQPPTFTKAEIMDEMRKERNAERRQDSHQSGMAAEAGFMAGAMADLGFKDDPDRDWKVKAPIEAMIKRDREKSTHANNPDRNALINAPYTKDEISTAAAALKPHLAAQARTEQEKLADIQAAQNLPAGSLDDQGAGGRAQVPTDDMTRDQKREIAEKRYKAKHGVDPL